MHLGTHCPRRARRALADGLEDVLGAAVVIRRLYDVPWHFRMNDDADARMLLAHRFDLFRGKSLVDGTMALPQNHLRVLHLLRIEPAEDLPRIPDDHLLERNPHLVCGVASQMLVRQE